MALCSHSASLQQVCTGPTSPAPLLQLTATPWPCTLLLSHYSWRVLCSPGLFCYLAKANKHTQSTQGIPLDHLALEAREACVSGPHGTKTIGKILFISLPPKGYCTDRLMKHIPTISMERAYLLVLELKHEGQVSGFLHK